MSRRTRILRFVAGLGIVVAVLALSVALLPPWIHTYGATPEEVAANYPGDELLAKPLVSWTHAVTIDAPPEEVWPWVAQLGERRGGFYSYTFIENLIAGSDLYHNAGRIVPGLQNPKPGDVLIGSMLDVRAVQPGEWVMGESLVEGLGWTWLWALYPQGNGQTRLVVRMHIEAAPELMMPAPALLFVDVGGFVMENKMLRGIRERAEGYVEPAWVQWAEVAIWLVALAEGVAAAVLFLRRRAWALPLTVGVAAVLALIVFTFVQPPVAVRALVDAVLAAGVWWAARPQAVRTGASPTA